MQTPSRMAGRSYMKILYTQTKTIQANFESKHKRSTHQIPPGASTRGIVQLTDDLHL